MSKPVLLITGASTGIGRATAELAIQNGYRLALLARTESRLDALADMLDSDDVLVQAADVTDKESLADAVDATIGRFGQIDVVFANAGVGGEPGGFSSAPPDSWKKILMTNVFGLALTLRATAEHLKASGGQAVITSSIAGRRSLAGSMYSASKWAATGIGHGFRKEMEGTGVRVTLIEPGIVDTPFFDDPKPDMLKSEDIARGVLYAIEQPKHVEVHELMIVPSAQGSDAIP